MNREFLAERDYLIFQARQGGLSHSAIARRFNVSTKVVAAALTRQLERMNSEAIMAYPEVLRLELERLDTLQAAIWPLTQTRVVTLPNGEKVTVEPDIKATQQVLSIMDRRAKLMGIDRVQIDVTTHAETVRSSLQGRETEHVDSTNPEVEARQMMELMIKSGVFTEDVIRSMLPQALMTGAEDAEDADIIGTAPGQPGSSDGTGSGYVEPDDLAVGGQADEG